MKIRFRLVMIICSVGLLACEDILEVQDISGRTVNLLAPSSGTVLNNNMVNLNWEKIEEATGYYVQVASPNFENAAQILMDSIFVMDSLGYLPTEVQQTLINGSYEWRVKAFNSGFETLYSRNDFQVNGDENLDLTPPNTPQLVLPQNGSDTSNTNINFAWDREDVQGTAEKDSIFIYTDEALEQLEIKALGANKAFSTDLSPGTFYWLVRAYDNAGNESEASSTFNFTISN